MVGVEPTIFRLEGGRVIHCATWALLILMRLTTQFTGCGARTRDIGLKRPTLLPTELNRFKGNNVLLHHHVFRENKETLYEEWDSNPCVFQQQVLNLPP